MTLLLCPNVDQKETVAISIRAANHLRALGVRCVADDILQPILGASAGIEFVSKQHAEKMCDIVVAIGGDGTMLRVSQRAVAIDKPIFGINTGRVGFLSAFDGHAIDDITVESIGKLHQSNRLLLDLALKSNPDQHYYAVNDVVLSKSATVTTIEVDIEYGRYQFGTIRADGVIIATPTGSTAYSLSAGGPIVAPGVDAFLITPICAHTLVSRAFVLGSKDVVTITPSERQNNRAFIAVDGYHIGKIDHSDTVIIRTGEKHLRLLTSEKRNFYGILNREISEKD